MVKVLLFFPPKRIYRLYRNSLFSFQSNAFYMIGGPVKGPKKKISGHPSKPGGQFEHCVFVTNLLILM